LVDKSIDHPNWIVLVDPVFKALRKQRRLAPINPLNEAPHPIPPPKSGGIIQRESNNQVRFHTTRVRLGHSAMSAQCPVCPEADMAERCATARSVKQPHAQAAHVPTPASICGSGIIAER